VNITQKISFCDETRTVTYKGKKTYLGTDLEWETWCAVWGGTGMYGSITSDHILDELRFHDLIDEEYDGKAGTFVYYYCKRIRMRLRRIGLTIRGDSRGWEVQEVSLTDLLNPNAQI